MAEKLKMQSSDIIGENISFIESRFPNAIVETFDDEGKIIKLVDFGILKQELSNEVLLDSRERYNMTWPGKKKTIHISNSIINKTLRPLKDKSKDFEKTKNIYIEGDNLDVLKVLRETYLNKVDFIYIDPPYNAGADLIYKNNYEMSQEEFAKANYDIDEDGYIMTLNNDSCGKIHTNWLNMMYSRIKVARDLLSEKGCMVIAIDDNELINLVKICDEIFSEYNRIGIVTIVHKPEGRNQERYFATSNEYAIFYAKDKTQFDFEPAILDESLLESYDKTDEKGKYKLISFIAKNHGRDGYDKNLRINNPKNFYPIYVSPDCKIITLEKQDGFLEALPITSSAERTWRYIVESTREKIKNNELVATITNGKVEIWEKYRVEKGQLIKTHWIDKKYNATVYGTKVLDSLMKCKTFDFPKSIYLMEDILKICTKKDSLILDFFSGSATTAHAMMNLNLKDNGNRRFILVQLPYECDKNSEAYKNGYKTIPEIAEERIRRVGTEINNNNPLFANTLDLGFRVLKLDSSNMKNVYYNPKEVVHSLLMEDIDNVKEDRSSLDLLFQVMLELGVELSAKIEEKQVGDSTIFVVNESYLVACFDKDISDDVVQNMADIKPVYIVLRDASFSNDSSNINCEQTIKTISPSTELKVI